jgi:hypothetical protein
MTDCEINFNAFIANFLPSIVLDQALFRLVCCKKFEKLFGLLLIQINNDLKSM